MEIETPGIRTVTALGAALNDRRNELGLTQQEVADRLGTARYQLSRVEQGHATRQLEFVFELVRELDLSIRIDRS